MRYVLNGERGVRYNGRCKDCGEVRSFLALWSEDYQDERGAWQTRYVDAEGRHMPEINACLCLPHVCPVNPKRTVIVMRYVSGKTNPAVPCDARCTTARGHSCECSCGGKNHGADHAGGVA